MSQHILHCPKCGTMQASQERCEVCGTPLASGEVDGPAISGRQMAKLAAQLVALFGGIVLALVLLLWLALSWL